MSDSNPIPSPSSFPLPVVGISGLSVYLPRWRVDLEQWCEWSGVPWAKISNVIGHAFRVPGPDENVYTMAASAVLRLILDHDIPPQEVGFLGFGTESSTDNAAGAVIIKGMVDDALRRLGRPPLARACEAPEFKQACLGGVYALKGAARWLLCEGGTRSAIVVSADIAEYERGSSGEPTQGAGAVAMWVQRDPKLLAVELEHSGSSSSYRELDFRKPFARHLAPGYSAKTRRLHDFPVFNGRYSTTCYTDAVLHALDDLCRRTQLAPARIFDSHAAFVMHRPYHQMPIQALSAARIWSLLYDDPKALAALCGEAGVEVAVLRDELLAPDELRHLMHERGADNELRPAFEAVARHIRRTPEFRALVDASVGRGSEPAMQFGNLYTAALPAWLAAILDEAGRDPRGLDTGDAILAIGYGSGDAAEALTLRLRPGWREAAARIDLAGALDGYLDLDHAGYEAIHDRRETPRAAPPSSSPFQIEAVGERFEGAVQDLGVERYAYVG